MGQRRCRARKHASPAGRVTLSDVSVLVRAVAQPDSTIKRWIMSRTKAEIRIDGARRWIPLNRLSPDFTRIINNDFIIGNTRRINLFREEAIRQTSWEILRRSCCCCCRRRRTCDLPRRRSHCWCSFAFAQDLCIYLPRVPVFLPARRPMPVNCRYTLAHFHLNNTTRIISTLIHTSHFILYWMCVVNKTQAEIFVYYSRNS